MFPALYGVFIIVVNNRRWHLQALTDQINASAFVVERRNEEADRVLLLH